MNIPEQMTDILVIDDEEQILRALKSILTARNYQVRLATSGEKALDQAISKAPDLVVLDLTMPGMEWAGRVPGTALMVQRTDPHPLRARK